jgi:hypothetical protein
MGSQDPTDRETDRTNALARPRWRAESAGQVVMGPSFYVWDEVPQQAREWGIELANAWLARER